MSMTSPHDILSAYSRGELGADRAMSLLGMVSRVELVAAMSDVGHPLPRPDHDEVEAQVAAALPLLTAALAKDERDA